MAEVASGYKDAATSRHLRFKVQSLGRRLDELEEATKNLQKAEEELLELQDKVTQAEGSNSGLLAEVEALRKRVLRIEGKDEELQRAEGLCQLLKAKLEEEEGQSRGLRSEMERLQRRMAQLEKLEEAFGRSKNDCTQLCLSLHEERNLTKKITAELEALRLKVRELEASEDRLGRTERSLAAELDRLKALTLGFVSERRLFSEKEKENARRIEELTRKLELKHRIASGLRERGELRIEDGLTPPSKEARRKGALADYLKQVENETRNQTENDKNRNQEDNKVQALRQEVERLTAQLKRYEALEEELKKMRTKNNDLHDSFLSEQNRNRLLAGQLEEIKLQVQNRRELENGEAGGGGDDPFPAGRGRPERAKGRGPAAEPPPPRTKAPELSPQPKRERPRPKEPAPHGEQPPSQGARPGPGATGRRAAKGPDPGRAEERPGSGPGAGPHPPVPAQSEGKKAREQPSVLSRYPPAAHEHRAWRGPTKPGPEGGLKGRAEKAARVFGDLAPEERPGRMAAADALPRVVRATRVEALGPSPEPPLPRSHAAHRAAPGPALELGGSRGGSPAPVTPAPTGGPPSEGPAPKGRRSGHGPESDPGSLPNSRGQEGESPEGPPPGKEAGGPSTATGADCGGGGGPHQTLRCRVSRPGSREKPDAEEDTALLVTATLVTTTVTPESDSKKPGARAPGRSRGAARAAALPDGDRDPEAETVVARPARVPPGPPEGPDAPGKARRPYSPREALWSRGHIQPVIVEKDVKEVMGGGAADGPLEKPRAGPRPGAGKVTSSITIYPSDGGGEGPRERHTSTSNIRVAPAEPSPAAGQVHTPVEISIHKTDLTLQLSEAERPGDASPRPRPETVVSRSSFTLRPSDSAPEGGGGQPPAETIRWKGHQPSPEAGPADGGRHVTVRSAWKSKWDVGSPGTQRATADGFDLERAGPESPWEALEVSPRRAHSSLTASELPSGRPGPSDGTPAAAWSRPPAQEEGGDGIPGPRRRRHRSAERPEPPAQKPSCNNSEPAPEPVAGRGQERARPPRRRPEDN